MGARRRPGCRARPAVAARTGPAGPPGSGPCGTASARRCGSSGCRGSAAAKAAAPGLRPPAAPGARGHRPAAGHGRLCTDRRPRADDLACAPGARPARPAGRAHPAARVCRPARLAGAPAYRRSAAAFRPAGSGRRRPQAGALAEPVGDVLVRPREEPQLVREADRRREPAPSRLDVGLELRAEAARRVQQVQRRQPRPAPGPVHALPQPAESRRRPPPAGARTRRAVRAGDENVNFDVLARGPVLGADLLPAVPRHGQQCPAHLPGQLVLFRLIHHRLRLGHHPHPLFTPWWALTLPGRPHHPASGLDRRRVRAGTGASATSAQRTWSAARPRASSGRWPAKQVTVCRRQPVVGLATPVRRWGTGEVSTTECHSRPSVRNMISTTGVTGTCQPPGLDRDVLPALPGRDDDITEPAVELRHRLVGGRAVRLVLGRRDQLGARAAEIPLSVAETVGQEQRVALRREQRGLAEPPVVDLGPRLEPDAEPGAHARRDRSCASS